jgi:hypothetical protein
MEDKLLEAASHAGRQCRGFSPPPRCCQHNMSSGSQLLIEPPIEWQLVSSALNGVGDSREIRHLLPCETVRRFETLHRRQSHDESVRFGGMLEA